MMLNTLSRLVRPNFSRWLYSSSALGMDKFQEIRNKTKIQLGGQTKTFKEKMYKLNQEKDSIYMVFTEDLKNMIYLASEDDLPLVRQMTEKFASQNNNLRFGQFVFGPQIMRVHYLFSKPDDAFKIITSPTSGGVYHQMITFLIAMDLLYKHGMYDKVEILFNNLQELQMSSGPYPKDLTLLLFASLYQQNTDQSFTRLLSHLKNADKAGAFMLRRSVCFAAALALKQNQPEFCLELLQNQPQSNTLVKNLQLSALCDASKLDEALTIIYEGLTNEDSPCATRQPICQSLIEKITNTSKICKSLDVSRKADRLIKILQNDGHITDDSMDNLLEGVDEKFQQKEFSKSKFRRKKKTLKNQL